VKVAAINCSPSVYNLGKGQDYRRLNGGSMKVKVAIPLAIRFWDKVQLSEGCWTWTGATTGHGYGVLSKGRDVEGLISAHRLAYKITYGPIPCGMNVCHKCDNPRCVRPDHLFLGTQKDNVLDMINKGRQRYKVCYGEDHGCAKLTTTQVIEIRDELKNGTRQVDLAARYSVTQATISHIKLGKKWGWL